MKHKKRIAARKLRQQYLGSTVSTPLAARPSLMAKLVEQRGNGEVVALSASVSGASSFGPITYSIRDTVLPVAATKASDFYVLREAVAEFERICEQGWENFMSEEAIEHG